MSDYHILDQSKDNKTVKCVFHYNVPTAGTNSAGHSWVVAVRMRLFSKDESGNEQIPFSVLPGYHPSNYPGGIDTAEESKIAQGEVIEETKSITFSSINLTPAQRRAEIEVAHIAWEAETQSRLQVELDWTGYRADVT